MLRGPSLEIGKHYQLHISGDWQDVHGQTLTENTTKEITVVEAYREKIKPTEWAVEKPTINSLDKLSIHFDRIIDHALIQSMIQIRDSTENLVEGYWEILDYEQQIQFVPKNKWEKGSYKIEFDTRLEDVSGNNLNNLLDHHITERGTKDKSQFIYFNVK